MGSIYIGHPATIYDGCPSDLIGACVTDGEFNGRLVRAVGYAKDNSLDGRQFYSRVQQDPGPVLLMLPVQEKTVVEIRRRLAARYPLEVLMITCAEELEAALMRLCRLFDSGEPLQAMDLVVALLVMRKLDQELMWAGYAKSYMWAADIPKGRGVKEAFQPRVANVLNILLQRGYLVNKISNGSKKYALNPARRREIYGILRVRAFPEDVQRVFLRCAGSVSVRELDLLDDYRAAEEDEP